MKVRFWVLVAAAFGGFIAVVYTLAGAVGIGAGFAAATAVGLATQLRPEDRRGIAGGRVRNEAKIAALKAISIAFGLACVFGFLVRSAINHWGRSQPGLVAILALTGLEATLFIELRRQVDDLLNRLRGAVGEETVRDLLDPLRDEGWIVVHNWDRQNGGNIDHIVIGETGAFAIETKSGRYRSQAGGQAIGAAMAVRELTGVGWVTAVACVADQDKPTQKGPLWVVGPGSLVGWLTSARLHRGRPIDTARARAAFELGGNLQERSTK
jgi:Nuclease-related domain